MSIDTLTINLDPSDVTITTFVDPVYGPQYTLTLEKSKAAFFANFLLNGLTPADQARIPLGIKQNIVQGTGLKYVFRLPSITRSLLIGAAAGIALKTFSDHSLPSYFSKNSPKLLQMGIEKIQCHPYISSLAIAGSATISTLVSQEVAQLVSDTLEGIKASATKTATIGLNGLKAIKDFCCDHPKTSAAIGTIGGAIASYHSIPSVQNNVASMVKFATDLVKKIS
jgi:hypothetical protein